MNKHLRLVPASSPVLELGWEILRSENAVSAATDLAQIQIEFHTNIIRLSRDKLVEIGHDLNEQKDFGRAADVAVGCARLREAIKNFEAAL